MPRIGWRFDARTDALGAAVFLVIACGTSAQARAEAFNPLPLCPRTGTVAFRDAGPPLVYHGTEDGDPSACKVSRGGNFSKPGTLYFGAFDVASKDWQEVYRQLRTKGVAVEVRFTPPTPASTSRRITWTLERPGIIAVSGRAAVTWSISRLEEGMFSGQDSGDALRTTYWLDSRTNLLLQSRYEVIRSLTPVPYKPEENWTVVSIAWPAGPAEAQGPRATTRPASRPGARTPGPRRPARRR